VTSLNERAAAVFERVEAAADVLEVAVDRLPNGAAVLDAGVEARARSRRAVSSPRSASPASATSASASSSSTG
jgi:hypothetical protein